MPGPYVTTQKLRFCDTDKLGHVNNAVYAVMYEAGRAELMDKCGLLTPDGAFGVVIARLELDFLREMNWPADVRIETEVARIGAKSLHLHQRLLVEGSLVSRATSVLAVIDTTTRRAVPIAEAWREALEHWLAPPPRPV
ncbi:MAG: acyl-CoA thioesterase [Rhodospirillales bacterium]|nr:acyl-CoA thioesterase [Rhodospirillales bacterium]MDE2198983.1 acyl-CoA thioesterase [Rhodospirillales bacterium]MDE2576412.1 acyl-CoA thioesterase [Rhodospirillales bacterium]